MVKHYCDWCGAECKESELTGINVPTKNLGNGSYLTKKIDVCPACNKEHDKILDMLIEFRIAAYNNLFIQKGARE